MAHEIKLDTDLANADESKVGDTEAQASSFSAQVEEEAEYPSSWKLLSVVVALVLAVFTVRM